MTDLSALIDESKTAIEAAVSRAFDAGRELGRKETMNQMKSRMASMFDSADVSADDLPVEQGVTKHEEQTGRASPGSVKPKIEQMLRLATNGLTASEIVDRTGFKSNTVRGTLWTLGNEGFAGHEGGRWYIKKEGSPSSADGDPFE